MFFKKSTKENIISVKNLVAIDGYQVGDNGNKYVALVEDLTLFRGFNAKSKDGVKPLLLTAKVCDISIADKYGEKIIVVSKEFMKLPKKQKLALLEIENIKTRELDSRFKVNADDDVISTNLDRKAAAELCAMEKYGTRTVSKALTKANKKLLTSEKRVGKFMNKQYKKSKSVSHNMDEELDIPNILSNISLDV